jgi:hypothetical protein
MKQRICQKAQQGAYIEEIPESLLGEVLEHNFCLVAFKINEDELTVYSINFSIQNSGQNDTITENMAQNANLNTGNEEKSKINGEEPIFNEPFTYDEAMKAPDVDKWMKAMEVELNTLNKMCIWDIVQPSANTNIVGSKWVYHYKYNPSSLIIKRRARLVAQGFTQMFGVDYNETFSLIMYLSSLWLICTLAARNN